MSGNDAQALRDMRHFTNRLLDHAELLPPDLAAMLRGYGSELRKAGALKLLAVRGELGQEKGIYYVRSRDESSR